MVRREAWRQSDGRRNIRHTSGMPVVLDRVDNPAKVDSRLRDIGQGGVGVLSQVPLRPGETCRVEFPLLSYPVPVVGKVVWCKPDPSGYSAGLQFLEDHPYSHARLVVDVCHVEFYRRDQRQRLGRELDHAQAITEWRMRHTAAESAQPAS